MQPPTPASLYAIRLKALWAIPAVLERIDLNAMLEHAALFGSPADIQLIETLIVAKRDLPEKP